MASDRYLIFNGLAWKFGERIASQGMSFVVSVVLARLLLPEQYGVIALINIFIVFANLFVTSGFTSALVQKKDADAIDFSTVFYCCFVSSVILYVVMFFAAPYIASFYKMPELTKITRVYSLSLILSSYNSVQNAYISRNLLFKKTFLVTLFATLASGAVGIGMAYMHFGVWALVGQYLTHTIVSMIILSFIIEWHPIIAFSVKSAKQLMNYGSKILAADVVNTIMQEIRQLIIGKYYSAKDLALYNRGGHLPSLLCTNIDTTLRTVLFPIMSNHSDNVVRVRQLTSNIIRLSSYITFFGLTVMAVCAEPIIRILLTDKWIACVPYMQVMCISKAIGTVSLTNLQAMKAIGKSDELLKLEVFKKPVFLILVLLSARISVMAIALTMPLYALYALIMNMGPTKRLLNYGHRDQMKDLFPAFALNIIVILTAYPIVFLNLNDWITLFLQIVVSIISYLVFSRLFKVFAYQYLLDNAKAVFRKVIKH